MTWIEYRPLPAHARLNFPSPGGEHPLTPAAVRERYLASIADSRLVVWCDDEAGLAGVRAGIDEVAWELGSGAGTQVELEFAHPAKGSGYFVLSYLASPQARPTVIVQGDRFDKDHLDWHWGLQAALCKATGARASVMDVGADA